jgi:hypothetical protein
MGLINEHMWDFKLDKTSIFLIKLEYVFMRVEISLMISKSFMLKTQ